MSEQVGAIHYTVSADTKPLIDQTRVVDRQTAKMAASFNAITAAVKILAVAMTLIKASQMADEMRLLGARVQVAAGSVEKGAAAMRELQRIATATQTSVAANAQVFQRLNQSLLQMGGTQADTLRLTELLGMAIKVSGASATESASAMLQFGQALGSGKLAGDELRSLLENAPYLMRQLAAGIGVPVGALKKLGEEGKLTADVVTKALFDAAGSIESDFKRMPQTIAAAMQAAVDAAGRANEAMDTLTGTSAALTGITKGAGDVFDMLATRLAGVTTEGDKLGRNTSVKAWAENTTTVLSYVADAADFVTRAFRQAGIGLGGMAASAAAIARGEFSQARDIIRQVGADIMAISDPKYAGAAMRQRIEAMAMGTDGSDPMDRRAAAGSAPSKLRPPPASPDSKGAAAAKRAAEKRASDYADSLDQQRQIEDEARSLGAKFTLDGQAKKEKEAADRASRVANLVSGTYAGTLRSAISDIEALNQAFNDGLITDTGEWADAIRIATAQIKSDTKKTTDDMSAFAKQAAANIQDTLGDTLESVLSGNFSNIGEMWAQTMRRMAAQAAAARLNSWLFGSDFGSSGNLGGVVGSLFSAASIAGGRQYGGPTSAGSLYRVNETGRPEMFTSANGSQYMMPTKSGRVTSADKVSGSGPTVVINQTINVGQGVSRGEVFAAAMQAKDAAKAEIMQTLYRTGRGAYA